MSEDWRPVSTAPLDGTRVRLLVETECVYDEHVPSALIGGWRRVGAKDRVIGWLPVENSGKRQGNG